MNKPGYVYRIFYPYNDKKWHWKYYFYDYNKAVEKAKEIIVKETGLPYESLYETDGLIESNDTQYLKEWYVEDHENWWQEEGFTSEEIYAMNEKEFGELLEAIYGAGIFPNTLAEIVEYSVSDSDD